MTKKLKPDIKTLLEKQHKLQQKLLKDVQDVLEISEQLLEYYKPRRQPFETLYLNNLQ